jgi:hypothetical protein
MSWSLSKSGFAGPVAVLIAEDIKRSKCVEPEETIKNTVGQAIILALEAYPPETPVNVAASGSQGQMVDGKCVNSLNVAITPMYGFVK